MNSDRIMTLWASLILGTLLQIGGTLLIYNWFTNIPLNLQSYILTCLVFMFATAPFFFALRGVDNEPEE